MLDVTGRDHVANEMKKAGRAETDFGEFADCGSDDGESVTGKLREQFSGTGKSDNIGDIFNFGALQPKVFGELLFLGGLGKQFLNAGEAGAAVGTLDDFERIEAVLGGPNRPHARHGRRGIDEHAVHIEKQRRAEDTSHGPPGKRNKYCGVKKGRRGREGAGEFT